MNTYITQTIRMGMVLGIALFAFAGEVFAAPTLIPTETVQIMETSATLVGYVENINKTSVVWFEWSDSSAMSPVTTIGMKSIYNKGFFQGYLYNLKPDTVYYYRAVATEGGSTVYSSVVSFRTAGGVTTSTTPTSMPAVSTNSVSPIYQNSATLNGTVTPNGSSTNAWFEWGTSSTLGNTTSSMNYGTTATNYSNTISNLSANTTYYYRAAASNPYGTVYGSMLSFVTTSSSGTGMASLPVVTTNSASPISQYSATLNGYVTPNGASTNAWFEWGTTASFGNVTSLVNYGTTATSYNSTLSSLSPNTTYYYRAVASNSQGTVYGSTLSFIAAAVTTSTSVIATNPASFISQNSATLNGYVAPKSTSTSAWFEWGTTSSFSSTTPSVNYGMTATSYSNTLSNLNSNTTYYYRAAASSSQETVYGSTLSFVTGTTGTQTTGTTGVVGPSPEATTLFATELTGTTAKLNGLVSTSADQSSNAWFEWGTSASLGNKTQSSNMGMLPVVKLSDMITGLVYGQTYYYRIVAENPYGKVYGAVINFVSDRTSVSQGTIDVDHEPETIATKPTVTVVGRGSAEQSLVTLTIDGGTETISGGEKRAYHIEWKNKDAQPLKNIILRVTFPQVMNIESATKGSFSSADNAVTVDIKTLASGEEGETFIFATSDRGIKTGEVMVVTANMVYTSASGVQGDALAYVTHRVGETPNVLSANIFGAGSFIPTTLFEWILLVILVLILVLLGNNLYGRFTEKE